MSADRDRARWRRRAFAELEAHPRFARFRHRRGRRTLVAVHLAWGALGFSGVGLMTESVVSGVVIIASGLMWLTGFIVLTGWLNTAVGGLTELPYDILDEAQTTVRRRAESGAYRAVDVVLVLIGTAAVLGLGGRYAALQGGMTGSATRDVTLTFPGGSWTWTLVTVAVVCSLLSMLPLYLLAWRLPDDLAEPEPMERAA